MTAKRTVMKALAERKRSHPDGGPGAHIFKSFSEKGRKGARVRGKVGREKAEGGEHSRKKKAFRKKRGALRGGGKLN